MSFSDRVGALWEGFKGKSKQYWWLYLVVIVVEEVLRDRAASAVNRRLSDKTMGDVLLWFLDSPLILLVALVGFLLALSYRSIRSASRQRHRNANWPQPPRRHRCHLM